MEFRDLRQQYCHLKADIDKAIQQVLLSSNFIGGAEVRQLEERLERYTGSKFCITCANGTDALTLALKAWNVGAEDAVFVPDFTFFSSGEAPACEKATPVFVDVDEFTYNLNPICLEKTVLQVLAEGKYTPKAVIAVDLFGQPAEYKEIRRICQKYGLYLLEDGAQGFGGAIEEKRACSFGDISITSFFPAKPLGCYGDGGAVFTDNREWADLIRSMAVHGKNAEDKYDNVRIGMNSRLDTMQAAVLRVKLEAFQRYELQAVNQVASWYYELLEDTDIGLPTIKERYSSSWAQFTIRLPKRTDRYELQRYLNAQGIPTMIYYPKPMHRQGAFLEENIEKRDCPVTEKLCCEVLSLPIHPYMKKADVEKVVCGIKEHIIKF